MMVRPPKDWPDGHAWASDWQHVDCADCLSGREPCLTYTIAADNRSITCLRCRMTSYNLNDIEQHYCGHCHVFHDDLWPPARNWWLNHDNRGNPIKREREPTP